jgi:excisionase family DNA binding protein
MVTAREDRRVQGLPLTLTPAEVAELLRLTPNAIYDKAKKNLLPGIVRAGGTLRFNRAAIEQLVSGRA